MNELNQPLEDADFELLLDSYYTFIRLDDGYEQYGNRLSVDKEFVEDVRNSIEDELRDRGFDSEYDDWLDLVVDIDSHSDYNPFDRTFYILEHDLVSDDSERFLQYWQVYEHFLDSFRDSTGVSFDVGNPV